MNIVPETSLRSSATIRSMIAGLLAMIVVFGLLMVAEKVKDYEHLNTEITRKFIHITVGSFVAFWPFFMSDAVIYAICGAFVAVIVFTRYSGLFPSIHNVQRKTWGDLLFPVGIAGTLFLAHDPWIFTAAILHLSLADGFAALVGARYGKHNAYKIMGYTKTLAGNAAFFVISLGIMVSLVWFDPGNFASISNLTLIIIPIFTTIIEAISVRGSDNLMVPILLTLLLNSL